LENRISRWLLNAPAAAVNSVRAPPEVATRLKPETWIEWLFCGLIGTESDAAVELSRLSP
jgi:hypothetical protein